MRLFEVEITFTAIVAAESMADAYSVASSETYEITSECDGDIDVGREIESIEELANFDYGRWDGGCLAYGSDDRTIGAILSDREPPPYRCKSTVDMFASGSDG